MKTRQPAGHKEKYYLICFIFAELFDIPGFFVNFAG